MSELEYNDEECYKHYKKFCEFCEKVLNYLNGLKTSVNPIAVKMNKFNKVYDIMEPHERQEIIIDCLYKPIKSELLQNKDDFSWMENKTVSLSLPGNSNKDRCVMCSTIYKKCVKLKADAEKDIEGLPESAAEGREELNFPDIFCLYYYRILKQVVVNKSENDKICKKLASVETDLGIKKEDNIDIKSNPLAGMGNLPGLGNLGNLNNLGQNIGSLIQNITPALGNIVKQDGKGGVSLNPSGFKEIFGKITESNPQLAKQMGETFGGIIDAKSPDEMLSAAVSKLQSPDVKNAMRTMMGGDDNKTLPSITDAEIREMQANQNGSSSAVPAIKAITSAEEQC